MRARGWFDPQEPFDEATTRAIQEGALRSDFASGITKKLVAASLVK
jgi:hypothetical protein